MAKVFQQEFHVRWSDLDPNRHMRHTAYMDMCATARLSYLAELGFTMEEFGRLQMGPILFTEQIKYVSEVHGGDSLVVDVKIAGLSEDGRKWKMRQDLVRKSDGKLAAQLEVLGAWFDLTTRKVALPPEKLKNQVETVPKTDDFVVI